jgi:hypothetical protein
VSRVPTKTSTPRLSDVARHVVVPKGAVTTAWPSVRDKCADLGISFRWWQHEVGKIVLAKRADGKYAATIGGTGLSIPRQVGKTFLMSAIVFALCLLRPNLTVIWTAHRLRTAEETFGKMQKFAKRAKIRPHVARLVLGSGEEAILFHNGSRILFGARESGFGLGFDEVDVLILDEAQRLRNMTLDDMVPATNQSRQPSGALLLFMGTPPRPTDSGEVFTRMRSEALSGEDADTGWIEFGADPRFTPTPKPAPMTDADWRQLAKANPSYPDDTPREAILRMRKQLDAESMVREGFGIWDEVVDENVFDPFPLAAWNARAQDVHPSGPPQFFITVEKSQRSAYIAVAADHDGVPHVGEADYRPGVAWLTGRVRELKARWPNAEFGAYSAGPVKAWAPLFAEFDVELELLSQPQSASAFAHMKKLVDTAEMTHSPTQVFADALKGAVWREGNAGAFDLDWRKSEGDPGPFAAAAGALWLLESVPQLGQPSVYYV